MNNLRVVTKESTIIFRKISTCKCSLNGLRVYVVRKLFVKFTNPLENTPTCPGIRSENTSVYGVWGKVYVQVGLYQSEDNFSIDTFKVRKKNDKPVQTKRGYVLYPLPPIGRYSTKRGHLVLTLSKCPHFKGVILNLVLALNASTNADRCSQDIKDDYHRCPKNSFYFYSSIRLHITGEVANLILKSLWYLVFRQMLHPKTNLVRKLQHFIRRYVSSVFFQVLY